MNKIDLRRNNAYFFLYNRNGNILYKAFMSDLNNIVFRSALVSVT
jgi:hypothetical protein